MIMKNLLHIYTLLICFVTVIILIITSSLFLNTTTDLLIPEYKYYSSLRHYRSNDEYIQYYEDLSYENMGKNKNERVELLKQLTSVELDEKRERERKQFLEDQKVSNIMSLISLLQWMFISAIFFFIHWRLYQRTKE
jgi:hypothetical protein